MAKFRKVPVVIDAVRFKGGADDPAIEVAQEWFECAPNAMTGQRLVYSAGFDNVAIPTLEGVVIADKGDWIIRGVKGEVYPCKPDIFDETYTPA